ncbi:hypothetical protein B0H14DRAFT_3130772 [Mycena olivaceomarginata]|nr:hypothetical protein B0H14DRAFT_3130772 [Mycena olivaceomarginata]
MSPLIAFIIGAGQDIDQEGWIFPCGCNIEIPESVQAAFAQITKDLGPPNVVIFNAATVVPPPVPEDPLTLSLEDFKRQTDVGMAVYAAAQEALKGFRSETIRKVMEWCLMEMLSTAYSKEGSRFYFVSLVGENGAVVEPLSSFFTSGPQHAQIYLNLITRDDQTDWEYRNDNENPIESTPGLCRWHILREQAASMRPEPHGFCDLHRGFNAAEGFATFAPVSGAVNWLAGTSNDGLAWVGNW